MRWPAALLIVVLASCTPQDGVPATGVARFSDYPASLFDAFRASCSGPTREFVSVSPQSAECQELMPPPITAAFILDYSGTPDDLPRLVIRFRARDDGDGVLVSNDVFVNIPQRRGGPRQVPFEDARLRRELNQLYISAGGIPEG